MSFVDPMQGRRSEAAPHKDMRNTEPPAGAAPDTPKSQSFDWVSDVHTLGPSGTNCERAARSWALRECGSAEVHLHGSMEEAASHVVRDDRAVLLGVVAYPNLHTIIYSHLHTLRLMDVFIMNTDNMVLASRTGAAPIVCATHPAPEKLLHETVERRFVSSNVMAANTCAAGEADSCITTLCAAQKHKLVLLQAFGPVPMGFTIHGPCSLPDCADAQLR